MYAREGILVSGKLIITSISEMDQFGEISGNKTAILFKLQNILITTF